MTLSATAVAFSPAPAPNAALAWRSASEKLSPKFQVGQFAFMKGLPNWDVNSELYDQLQYVNEGACKHPLLIVGSKDNGMTVTCLGVCFLHRL